MVCSSASPDCFGHTGFTGTCAWADPKNNIIFVFLSNRVHPDIKNQKINIYGIRQAMQQIVYDAVNALDPRFDKKRTGVASMLSEGDSSNTGVRDSILP